MNFIGSYKCRLEKWLGFLKSEIFWNFKKILESPWRPKAGHFLRFLKCPEDILEVFFSIHNCTSRRSLATHSNLIQVRLPRLTNSNVLALSYVWLSAVLIIWRYWSWSVYYCIYAFVELFRISSRSGRQDGAAATIMQVKKNKTKLWTKTSTTGHSAGHHQHGQTNTHTQTNDTYMYAPY